MSDDGKPDRLDRIEERLDRLTERHEALTMNLELAYRDIEALKIVTRELASLAERDGEHIRQLAQNSLILHDSIKRLEAIATAHEQRLDTLEGS